MLVCVCVNAHMYVRPQVHDTVGACTNARVSIVFALSHDAVLSSVLSCSWWCGQCCLRSSLEIYK